MDGFAQNSFVFICNAVTNTSIKYLNTSPNTAIKISSQQEPDPLRCHWCGSCCGAHQPQKDIGGLVGITQNASARERFFMTAPELSGLAEEAQMMAGSPIATQ